MIQEILSITYFLVPAGFANMAPVIGKKLLPQLAKPVDCGKSWRGKRIFGANKTWRGFIFGAIVGIGMLWLQQYLYQFSFFQSISLVNYPETSVFLGFWLGVGALMGDSIESFFKRRVNIAPGQPWIPFDQIDDAIGAMVFAIPFYWVGWTLFAYGIVIYFILNILVNWFAYYTGIRKEKW